MDRVLVSVVAAVVVLAGCTTTKLAQRDGCWVRRSERWLGSTKEEIGPCARPASPWAEDRLTRLTQECMSRDDWRWQERALAAWNRGEPLPPHASEGNALQACMSDAAATDLAQQAALRREVEVQVDRAREATADRDALRVRADADRDATNARADADRERLLGSQAKLADWLGEAANKAQQPAVATATSTSEGRASTEHSAEQSALSAPAALPASAPVAATRRVRTESKPRPARKVECTAPISCGPSSSAQNAAEPARAEHAPDAEHAAAPPGAEQAAEPAGAEHAAAQESAGPSGEP